MPLDAVEEVQRHNVRQLTVFEEVYGGKAVCKPSGVDEDNSANSSVNEFVPHEPESVLPRRAKQIKDQFPVERDPAEVHRHRGGRLVRCRRQVVDALLASVITASVVSGTISDTEPTNVVLPTPNPPR